MNTCPLCHSTSTSHYHQDKTRDYFQCSECALVFVTSEHLPSSSVEKDEYDKHENLPDDPGYRRFLSRISAPLLNHLNTSHDIGELSGIDFGCGPGPALAMMLDEAGIKMSVYDPFYAPDKTVLKRKYDVITCTEAIEHFHRPAKEWALFMDLLGPGGCLAIMTKRVIDQERFATWHYKNDITHVSFFSEQTFEWLAKRHGLDVSFPADDVVLFNS